MNPHFSHFHQYCLIQQKFKTVNPAPTATPPTPNKPTSPQNIGKSSFRKKREIDPFD
jgi:hypothetical protein